MADSSYIPSPCSAASSSLRDTHSPIKKHTADEQVTAQYTLAQSKLIPSVTHPFKYILYRLERRRDNRSLLTQAQ